MLDPSFATSLASLTRRPRLFRVAFALHLSLIVAVGALAYSGRVVLPPIPHFDKYGHALFFGVLGALADGALSFRRVTLGHGKLAPSLPLGPLLVLLAAGVEELCQGLSPHRTMSGYDYAADVVGVVLFVTLLSRVRRRASAGARRWRK